MPAYIARRMLWAGLVLLVVSTMTFLLTFLAPADPARSLAGPKSNPATVERVREALGLGQPILDQLVAYYWRLIHLDLGLSFRQGIPVLDLILARLPATIELAIAGLALAIAIGVPLGVLAASRPGSTIDRIAGVVSSVLVSIPGFILGIGLLYVLAFLPRTMGFALLPLPNSNFHPLDMRSLILPALTLGLLAAPFYIRVTRTAMLDELHQEYIRTARAKGLQQRRVVWRHALRNALPPVVNQAGLDLGLFLGGVVVIEAAFSWPGIGRQAVKSLSEEDLPLLMGIVFIGTLAIVLANLAADVLQALIDPRVRLES
jgi:peptide/nickel transport system permease protein